MKTENLGRWVALALTTFAFAASAVGARDPSKDFEDGKELGRSKTGPQVTEIQSGKTANDVPNYTDNPPEKTYYSTRDLSTPRAQQQADCAARPTDPTCAGITQATQPRPTSTVTRSDPALAGEDAQKNPSSILGDIATTYSACSVGTPKLVSPARFNRETCSSIAQPWSTTQCEKRLTAAPNTRTSCEQGTLVASGASPLGKVGESQASVVCDVAPKDGLATFHVTVVTAGKKPKTVTSDVKLSLDAALPALGQDPPKVATLSLGQDWLGSTTMADVYAIGPGCVAESCAMRFHYFVGGVQCTFDGGGDGGGTCVEYKPGFLEAKFACPDQQLAGNELFFVTCVGNGDSETCTEDRGDRHQCWGPSGPRGALLAHPLGNNEVGYWKKTGASTPTQQAIIVPSSPAGQPSSLVSLSFQRPRVLATANETWDNACAALEAITPQLPADGVTAPGRPVLAWPMPAGQQQCVRTASVCLDGPSTHQIDGVEVTRECWRWRNTFDCTSLTAESTCADPKLAGCSLAGDFTCTVDDGLGHCLSSTAQYDCKIAEAVYEPTLNCGEQSYCAGGSCYDKTYQPNENFAFAVSHMEARVEAGQQFDSTKLEIFKGSRGHCEKDTWGLRDCCDAQGDFLQCEADERETVRQRELGQCHYVGNYCSERDWIGGCLARTYSYCCFPSMLARIVQEQGRPQLNRDWGKSKEPSCEGFTLEEFQNLDWSRIDLSEFYDSIAPEPVDNDGNTGRAGQAQDGCYYGTGRCGP